MCDAAWCVIDAKRLFASIDSVHIWSVGPKARSSTTKTKRKRHTTVDDDDDDGSGEHKDEEKDTPAVARSAVEDAAAAAWSIDMVKQRELYDESDIMANNALRDARYSFIYSCLHLLIHHAIRYDCV
jgi:hypothetical protein